MTAHFGTKKVIKKVIKFPKTDIRYWEGKVAFQTPASRTYFGADPTFEATRMDQSWEREQGAGRV
jgi:hypothetical protein